MWGTTSPSGEPLSRRANRTIGRDMISEGPLHSNSATRLTLAPRVPLRGLLPPCARHPPISKRVAELKDCSGGGGLSGSTLCRINQTV